MEGPVPGGREAWSGRRPHSAPISSDAGLEVLPADRHPRRSYTRWRARGRGQACDQAAAGQPPKGPWPALVVDAVEPVVAKYAADWPAWGHRKIHWLMAADGIEVSASSVERAMRRRDLLQPVDYQGERRELAKARKAAFADPPTRPNQVWQLDFSEYETTSGGTWRLARVVDYFTKIEHGLHIAPTCTGADAIAAVQLAIAEAEALAGRPLAEALTDPQTEDGGQDDDQVGGEGGEVAV